jgi:hypothetical protein
VKQHAASNWTPKLRAAMAHGVGKAVDVLVSENEKLLGSWNEVWAEGFSHIIVGHATHVQVPGIMLSLIEYILRRA